jgi:hypothetical protein
VMFRSEHSLELTVHIVLNISRIQTHEESYIREFRSGMLGTHKYDVIVGIFIYAFRLC